MTVELWILVAIVFFSYTTQAISGFGAVVISVTLGANLFPIDGLVPVFAALNIVLTLYLVVRHRAHIEGRLLLRVILPYMGVGLVLGLLLFETLLRFGHSDWLKAALGILVALLATRELYRILHRALPEAPPGTVSLRAQILSAGVIHGMYATGGPLLVFAVARLGLDKAIFRSTLSAVWLALNGTLTVVFLLNGRLDATGGLMCARLLPALLLGIVLGELLHSRIPERGFRLLTFSILLIAGLALVRSIL